MSETLVIRLRAGEEAPASWLIVDGNGARSGPVQTGPVFRCLNLVDGRSVVLLLPVRRDHACRTRAAAARRRAHRTGGAVRSRGATGFRGRDAAFCDRREDARGGGYAGRSRRAQPDGSLARCLRSGRHPSRRRLSRRVGRAGFAGRVHAAARRRHAVRAPSRRPALRARRESARGRARSRGACSRFADGDAGPVAEHVVFFASPGTTSSTATRSRACDREPQRCR